MSELQLFVILIFGCLVTRFSRSKEKGLEEKSLVFRDLSAKLLIRKFITPNKLNGKLLSDNKIIAVDDLSFIQILKTKKCADSIFERLQEESILKRKKSMPWAEFGFLPSAGIFDSELAEYSEDVTSSFLAVGPGGDTTFNRVSKFINSPVVVRVF